MSAIAPGHTQPAFAGTRKSSPAFAAAPQSTAKFAGGLKSDKVQFGQHFDDADTAEPPKKSHSFLGRAVGVPVKKALKYGGITAAAGMGQLLFGIAHPLFLVTGFMTLITAPLAAGLGFLKGLVAGD